MSEFDNGDGTFDRFMSVDMSIEAKGPRYEAIVLYAWIMVALWVIGIPLALGALLYARHDEILDRETRFGGEELAYLAFFIRLVG